MIESWTIEEFQEYQKSGRTPNRDRTTVPHAEPKPSARHEPVAKKKTPRLDSRCRITFHHYRKRLIDADNLYGKPVVDGLRHVGILADDSSKYVAEVRHTQTKIKAGEQERTVIVIEEIE